MGVGGIGPGPGPGEDEVVNCNVDPDVVPPAFVPVARKEYVVPAARPVTAAETAVAPGESAIGDCVAATVSSHDRAAVSSSP